MKKIKLMADYECYPLWNASAKIVGNIDPDSLPISSELKDQLMNWSSQFDATLDRSDPRESGFADEQSMNNFVKCAHDLHLHLQQELTPDIEVELFIGELHIRSSKSISIFDHDQGQSR